MAKQKLNLSKNLIACQQNCKLSIVPTLLVQKWKQVLSIYIKYLKEDSISTNDKSTIEAIAMDCSDEYGDAIHMARSLANTYNNVYFDTYDDCTQITPRTKGVVFSENTISISPNPSQGKINIVWSIPFNGMVTIYNTDGSIIQKVRISNQTIHSIDLSSREGLHYLRFTGDDGGIVNRKIIIIK